MNNERPTTTEKPNYKLPAGLMRLHVELDISWYDEVYAAKRYAGVRHGDTISRDIIVPKDIPLRALHFALQRAFGFQGGFSHRFLIKDRDMQYLTDNNAENYINLLGIIFGLDTGVLTDVWTPEFKDGYRNRWMKDQYTAPYAYNGEYLKEFYGKNGEPSDNIHNQIMQMPQFTLPDDIYYLMIGRNEDEGQYRVLQEEIVKNAKGIGPYYKMDFKRSGTNLVKCGPDDRHAMEAIRVRLGDLPATMLEKTNGYPKFHIIERLPLSTVLAISDDYLPYDQSGNPRNPVKKLKWPQIITSSRIAETIEKDEVILPKPFTSTLFYRYSTCGSWLFRITGSGGCSDLEEEGVIDKDLFDAVVKKVKEEKHPVVIASDGEMLAEQTGGFAPFIDTLKALDLKDDLVIKERSDYVRPERCADTDCPEDILPEEEPTPDFSSLLGGVRGTLTGRRPEDILKWLWERGWHRNDFTVIDLL